MQNSTSWPDKDPGETLDYRMDWTARLTQSGVADTISSSTWVVTKGTGLSLTAQYLSSNQTVVWLGSGTVGVTYTVTNTIVTTAGRTMVQSGTLKVQAK
jgi:hypothetical protein